jgi:hypothetical protein
MVAKWTTFCFAGFGTDRLRCEEAMKTAGRENPNRWAKLASNRAHGAAIQNRSCSIKWAGKQEKLRPMEGCFFLTSPFIELIRTKCIVGVGGVRAGVGQLARTGLILPASIPLESFVLITNRSDRLITHRLSRSTLFQDKGLFQAQN